MDVDSTRSTSARATAATTRPRRSSSTRSVSPRRSIRSPSSIRALTYLAHRVVDLPIAVVVALRPDEPGTPKILKRGGQRVASLVCYLNTPEAGGATVFPDAGLDVVPVRGNAVFFSYDRPHPATRSLHGGAPVTEGEKWVATKWLREGRFE